MGNLAKRLTPVIRACEDAEARLAAGPPRKFQALLHQNVIEEDDDLDLLLESITGFWALDGGEDLAIWCDQLTLAAVVRGTNLGPVIHRFPMPLPPEATENAAAA